MKILRFIILIELYFLIIVYFWINPTSVWGTDFHSSPDLDVAWGVKEGEAIFNIKDTKPCDEIKRDVKVYNKSDLKRKLLLASKFDGSAGLLAHGLYITVKAGNRILYGGNNTKSLDQFYLDSKSKDGIILIPLSAKQKITLSFIVNFPCSAGNEYQGKKTKFDLELRLDRQTLPKCKPLPVHCRFLFDYRHVPPCYFLYGQTCNKYGRLEEFERCKFD